MCCVNRPVRAGHYNAPLAVAHNDALGHGVIFNTHAITAHRINLRDINSTTPDGEVTAPAAATLTVLCKGSAPGTASPSYLPCSDMNRALIDAAGIAAERGIMNLGLTDQREGPQSCRERQRRLVLGNGSRKLPDRLPNHGDERKHARGQSDRALLMAS